MKEVVENRILCAVYDKKAESFGELVTFDSDAAAVRAFGDVLADTRTMIGRHPEDYQLVKLGLFDHLNGVVVGVENFVLCDGFSFARKEDLAEFKQKVARQMDGE